MSSKPNQNPPVPQRSEILLNHPKVTLLPKRLWTKSAWGRRAVFRLQNSIPYSVDAMGTVWIRGDRSSRSPHPVSIICSQFKYACFAKQLLEPERHVKFRVALIDDVGVHIVHMNRLASYKTSGAWGIIREPCTWRIHDERCGQPVARQAV